MQFRIVLSPAAVESLDRLRAYDRTAVLSALEIHLTHEPQKESKSRIKRLRGLRKPQYRLRVGQWRVYYDVTEDEVLVLDIVHKPATYQFLKEKGIPDETRSPGGN